MKQLNPGEPRQVGRYRLVALLGEGGMGRVLLGVGQDGRLVALKQVHPGFAHDEGFRSRFRREVETSRMVSGAYTAAVMDADPEAATPWLASVFVAGPSLREAVDAAGPLPVESIRFLAVGLASALTEIHRVGLIHRDLKPSNVMLTDDGPRVIDFGIARAVDAGSELTHTGSIIGSPGFMSPEQADGRPVTPASDVFSLGALLVMAATGQGPFTGTSTPQTLYNVVHSQPDLRMVHPAIRRLAEPCLAKDPAKRPTPAQILDFLGPVVPTATPWPPAVQSLIAKQKTAVRHVLSLPPPQATAAAPARKQGRRWGLAVGAFAGAIVLIAATIVGVKALNRDAPTTLGAGPTTSSTTGTGISVEKLRLLDVCALINRNDVAKYDPTSEIRISNWRECTTSSKEKGTDKPSFTVGATGIPEGNYPTASGEINGFSVSKTDQSNYCSAAALMVKSPPSGITTTARNLADGKNCEAALVILRSAVDKATTTPPLLDQPQGSLVTTDPCTVLTAEVIKATTGFDAPARPTDLRACDWQSNAATVTVEINGLYNRALKAWPVSISATRRATWTSPTKEGAAPTFNTGAYPSPKAK
ncbi:serine/threonine-protein kinase [Amycolatopsis sp. NPDC059657]|uniref:serine/threonine-protein kinase n=1 Tax=Amycolatopsis sp. NPDC059657 TaxID=3346899 RepID=UPI00366F4341